MGKKTMGNTYPAVQTRTHEKGTSKQTTGKLRETITQHMYKKRHNRTV
jgi:hypothetical protein